MVNALPTVTVARPLANGFVTGGGYLTLVQQIAELQADITRLKVDAVVNAANELSTVLSCVLHDGDLLLLMGAGDIGAAAQQIARDGLQGAGA